VWKSENQELKWSKNNAEVTKVDLPYIVYDSIKIEFIDWHGLGAGLSEIQLLVNKQNILTPKMITVSSSLDDRYGKQNLTDNILNSSLHAAGYWLLPANEKGWLEIKL
jgi:hypothetical protein